MSVLGKIDAKALANDVSVTQNDATVVTTGDFTDDTTADYIEPGDILSLDGVQYLVKSVTDANNLELHTVYAGSTGTVAAADAIRRTAPKIVAQYVVKGGDSNVGSLVFLDADEAELTENKVRGLNGPGWWIYKTYTDMSGNTRHKAECIAPLYVSAAVAGDYADNPAADATSTIIISVQPANQTTYTPAGSITTYSITNNGTTLAGEEGESYELTGLSGSVAGTGAAFTVTRAADYGGDVTAVTIDAVGSGFEAAETITISGIDIGGQSGAVATFTEGAGTTLGGEADETYTAVSVTGGTGNDDTTFTVVRDNTGAIDSVTLVAAGSGYTAADTLTILGSDIGGVDTTDDLTITVDTVTTDDVTLTVDTIGTAAATFSVTAADVPDLGDIIYQWQSQTASGTRWTNVSGATSSSLALTGLTTADSGRKYRVKLTSTAGAEEVISDVVTLTVDDNIFA
jgi:hypothetical protein